MEAFTTFKGIGIPIDIINCDTDQIIPARFLRRDRTDPEMPNFLWHDLRENPDFIFNKTPFNKGKVVVADINWGCGSSREGAPSREEPHPQLISATTTLPLLKGVLLKMKSGFSRKSCQRKFGISGSVRSRRRKRAGMI